mmetsp:Transcript_90010/g.159368  ORF Transcript_90010/g.159368 Transcript_90010/m.159368 type:complete len:1285 (-) Transcript_90010:108-3962(-)
MDAPKPPKHYTANKAAEVQRPACEEFDLPHQDAVWTKMLDGTTEPGEEEIKVIHRPDMECIHPPEPDEVTAADVSEMLSAAVCDADLQQAAIQGDVDGVRYLIGAGTSVNAPMRCNDPDGDVFQTLMHVLSSQPDLPDGMEVLAEIVKMKANLNARSSLGATPLSCACLHKHVAAAELLLAYGADVKPRDDRGRDAVHCAVILAHSPGRSLDRTSSVLAKKRKSDKSRGSNLLTVQPVEHVVRPETPVQTHDLDNEEELSAQLITLLAEKHADLNACGDAGAPLLEAIQNANMQAVVALTEAGAQARYLHEAVEEAPFAIIDHLLQAQANPFEEDGEGQTVLDIAFRRGDEVITTLLRDRIGDLERARGNKDGFLEKRIGDGSASRSLTFDSEDSAKEEGGLGLSSDRTRKESEQREERSQRHSLRRISLGGSYLNKSQVKRASQKVKGKLALANEDSKLGKFLRKSWRKLQESCVKVNQNRWFQFIMLSALLAALFLPDLWVIADMQSNQDLDVILVLVLILFLIELAVQVIGMPKVYINSFFFWMDVVGAVSVPLDHSTISDQLPRNFDNAVVMRAARMARLGARAGRFTKLVKLLRFLPGVHQHAPVDNSHGTAKTMSNALMMSLSTRVSCLIIVMVMVLPLFDLATYPENDFSMKTWMNALDYTMNNYPGDIPQRIKEFDHFYNNKDYYPVEVELTFGNGTKFNTRLPGRTPRRPSNRVDLEADSGKVQAVFNFEEKNGVDALCNIVLIITIITLMMGFSLLLSNSVSAIVLQPLEKLLSGVKQMASKIFKSVTSMTKKVGSDTEEGITGKRGEEIFGNETELLEKVIDKLAALNAITMKTSPIDAETLEQLGENERAVLQGFHADQLPTISVSRKSDNKEQRHSIVSTASVDSAAREDNTADLVLTLEKHLEEAGIDWAHVDSFEFNSLDIEEHQRHLVCLCFLIFHLGLSYTSDQQTVLTAFTNAAANGYCNPKKVPYHNWYHAVDVSHCVFRLLNLCSTERYLSSHERYALIVSAVCHDIGHPGLNNPFLVETSHELAIRYNDHSPLENMHCAKLFAIVSQPKTAVFAQLEKAQYREVRQVCIEAILHTDNTHHFAMVKELQMLYEMNSDVFDIALQMFQASQLDFPPREIVEIFSEGDKKKLIRNLILHFSDVSNPTKPFHICKMWAWHIVDEFFLQGDKEKEMGITVQPLNDREKVNRPYSQVGFIEFFVAPFAFATVRLLPPLVPCTDQMMQNLNSWCEEWVTTTIPTPDSEEQVKLQDRIAKLEARFIFREGF